MRLKANAHMFLCSANINDLLCDLTRKFNAKEDNNLTRIIIKWVGVVLEVMCYELVSRQHHIESVIEIPSWHRLNLFSLKSTNQSRTNTNCFILKVILRTITTHN